MPTTARLLTGPLRRKNVTLPGLSLDGPIVCEDAIE